MVTYCNAFDAKMSYHLGDKNPYNLNHYFNISLNIEINMRASRKVGRRDDVKILKKFKHDKGSIDKGLSIEDKLEKVLSLLTLVNKKLDKHEKGLGNNNPCF